MNMLFLKTLKQYHRLSARHLMTQYYVYWRNKATELKRVSKSIYYMELIIASKNNTRKLWKFLSELPPKEILQDPVTLRDG